MSAGHCQCVAYVPKTTEPAETRITVVGWSVGMCRCGHDRIAHGWSDDGPCSHVDLTPAGLKAMLDGAMQRGRDDGFFETPDPTVAVQVVDLGVGGRGGAHG